MLRVVVAHRPLPATTLAPATGSPAMPEAAASPASLHVRCRSTGTADLGGQLVGSDVG